MRGSDGRREGDAIAPGESPTSERNVLHAIHKRHERSYERDNRRDAGRDNGERGRGRNYGQASGRGRGFGFVGGQGPGNVPLVPPGYALALTPLHTPPKPRLTLEESALANTTLSFVNNSLTVTHENTPILTCSPTGDIVSL